MKIIALIGNKGHGKDTVADYLVTKGFRKLAFADPLREATLMLTGYSSDIFDTDKKDKPLPKERKAVQEREAVSARQYLKEIAKACQKLNNNIFVDHMFMRIKTIEHIDPNAKLVISDVRFRVELEMLEELGAETCYISRSALYPEELNSWMGLLDYMGAIFPGAKYYVPFLRLMVLKWAARKGYPDYSDRTEREVFSLREDVTTWIHNDGTVEDLHGMLAWLAEEPELEGGQPSS